MRRSGKCCCALNPPAWTFDRQNDRERRSRFRVADYLATLPQGPEALIFPGSRNGDHMNQSSHAKPWYRARANVGLPNLRWHDLRHFAVTTAAQTGATLAEIQGRLGHPTVQAAMRYQHASSGRDAEIADAISKVAMSGTSRKSANVGQ
jgi:integrase